MCFEFHISESVLLKHILCDGNCVDISENGLGLTTDYYLRKGDILKLLLPDNCMHSKCPLFAEVVWMKPSNGYFRIGLKLLSNT